MAPLYRRSRAAARIGEFLMAHVRRVDRKGGSAYEVRWRANDKHLQRTFRTQREARRFASTVDVQLATTGNSVGLVRKSPSFESVAQDMLTSAGGVLRFKSVQGYEAALRLYAFPHFGTTPIASITTEEVENWMALLRNHVSSKTHRRLSDASVRSVYISVQKVFAFAVTRQKLRSNPFDVLTAPKVSHSERTPLSATDVERVAEALKHVPAYSLMVRFAAYTGLRQGEMAALRILDIDLKARCVRVSRSCQMRAGAWEFTEPKTRRGRREVPLPGRLVPDLESYLQRHPRLGFPESPLWPGSEPGNHGTDGPVLTFDRQLDLAGVSRRYFKPAAKRVLGREARWHDLRHSYASLMAAAGVDIYKVSRWMGHSDVKITDGVYTHMFREDHDDDLAKVDLYLD